MSNIKGFFRRNGKVIPIRVNAGHVQKAARGYRVLQTASAASKTAIIGSSLYELHKKPEKKSLLDYFKPKIKVHRGLDMAGLALSTASGALGAYSFHKGVKGLVAGTLAGHGLDAIGIAANVASVRGHGQFKERAKQAARQEARNFLVGNAIFYGGVLAQKKTRQQLASAAVKLASFAKKAMSH